MKALLKKLLTWIKLGLAQLWSLVSDYERDFDPWKLLGVGCFILAAVWGSTVFRLALAGRDSSTLGILAGMVSAFIAVGTFLFGQSRKSDAAMIEKSKGAP
jgi:hypothetical protein